MQSFRSSLYVRDIPTGWLSTRKERRTVAPSTFICRSWVDLCGFQCEGLCFIHGYTIVCWIIRVSLCLAVVKSLEQVNFALIHRYQSSEIYVFVMDLIDYHKNMWHHWRLQLKPFKHFLKDVWKIFCLQWLFSDNNEAF